MCRSFPIFDPPFPNYRGGTLQWTRIRVKKLTQSSLHFAPANKTSQCRLSYLKKLGKNSCTRQSSSPCLWVVLAVHRPLDQSNAATHLRSGIAAQSTQPSLSLRICCAMCERQECGLRLQHSGVSPDSFSLRVYAHCCHIGPWRGWPSCIFRGDLHGLLWSMAPAIRHL